MAEQVDLTNRDQTNLGTDNYHIVTLTIDVENLNIFINLKSADGNYSKQVIYQNVPNAIKAINKGNFTQKSLQRTIMEKMIADGNLTGTVSGVPE